MGNIKRIAEDIFKAPTQEELKARAKEFYDALLNAGREIAKTHSSVKDDEAILTVCSIRRSDGFLTFKSKSRQHTVELKNFLEVDIIKFFEDIANTYAADVHELKQQIYRWTKTRTKDFDLPLARLSVLDAYHRIQQIIWQIAGNIIVDWFRFKDTFEEFVKPYEFHQHAMKLAEEIFKAPSRKELAERLEFLTKNELAEMLKREYEVSQSLLDHIVSLFPRGARRSSSLAYPWKFNIIRGKIESQVNRWQFLGTVQTEAEAEYERDETDFFKAVLKNGTNALKIVIKMPAASLSGNIEVTSYLFETL